MGAGTFWLALLVVLLAGLGGGYALARRGASDASSLALNVRNAPSSPAPPAPPVPTPIPPAPPRPREHPTVPVARPDERTTTPVTGLPRQDGSDEDRSALVEVCIDLADRLRAGSPGLRDRVHRGLATVGVTPIEPDGRPFDRAQHDAVDSEPTTTPAHDRTVASTERTGYTDHGRVLRRPEVVVYALTDTPGDTEEVTDDDRSRPDA